jgi:plastocyanin
MTSALRLPASGAALRPPASGAALRLLVLGVALLLVSSCAESGVSEPTPSTSSSTSVPATTSTPSPPVSVNPSATRSPALQPLVVHIKDFAYVPAAPVAIVGQPIEIINDDVAAHTWSADLSAAAPPRVKWAYTSGNLEKGQRATFPGFTKPGRYQFLCYYHAEMPPMTGVVTVKAAP